MKKIDCLNKLKGLGGLYKRSAFNEVFYVKQHPHCPFPFPYWGKRPFNPLLISKSEAIILAKAWKILAKAWKKAGSHEEIFWNDELLKV